MFGFLSISFERKRENCEKEVSEQIKKNLEAECQIDDQETFRRPILDFSSPKMELTFPFCYFAQQRPNGRWFRSIIKGFD